MRNTILISLLFLSTFKLSGTNVLINKSGGQLTDTVRHTVIKFDQTQPYIFDKNNDPATLSDSDISQIEKLLAKKVSELNKEIKSKGVSKYDYIKNPSRFYKQLIAIINAHGEKEVWVNCFCSIKNEPNWKTSIVSVLDGGSCYFNFKVNLTTNTLYDLAINGVG